MEKLREVNNDEIVDSILSATLQCGLAVKKIKFQADLINIDIEGAERVVALDRAETVSTSLEELGKEIRKQLDG